MKTTSLLFGLLLLTIAACKPGEKKEGEKYAAVFQKHEARINDLRKFLSGLKSSLPEAGVNPVTIANLDPVLRLGDYDTTCNTLILQHHLLDAPENFVSYDSLFGLYYHPQAVEAFAWSGSSKADMIFRRDYLSDQDVDNILSPLSANRFPYLLIVKVSDMEPLARKTQETYSGGGATASYYLYDLRKKELLSSISITTAPDEKMLYAYMAKSGSFGKIDAAKRKAKETMHINMRAKVYAWLKTITNNSAMTPAI